MVVQVVNQLAGMGWELVNCDLTIVAEKPRLSKYKDAMRERVADLLGADSVSVAVKAKTAEGMGLIGAGEGLAAFAAVMIEDTET